MLVEQHGNNKLTFFFDNIMYSIYECMTHHPCRFWNFLSTSSDTSTGQATPPQIPVELAMRRPQSPTLQNLYCFFINIIFGDKFTKKIAKKNIEHIAEASTTVCMTMK